MLEDKLSLLCWGRYLEDFVDGVAGNILGVVRYAELLVNDSYRACSVLTNRPLPFEETPSCPVGLILRGVTGERQSTSMNELRIGDAAVEITLPMNDLD